MIYNLLRICPLANLHVGQCDRHADRIDTNESIYGNNFNFLEGGLISEKLRIIFLDQNITVYLHAIWCIKWDLQERDPLPRVLTIIRSSDAF